MTQLQKVIKYLAIALAVALIVGIVGAITTLSSGLFHLFSGKESAAGEMKTYAVTGEVSSLYLQLGGAQLQIKTGPAFSVESNHKYISVKTEAGRLTVRETSNGFTYSPQGVTVTLYIPEGFCFDRAEVETGAGTVDIQELSADTLELSLGAGKAEIRNLYAFSRATVEGGAGELVIDGGQLCNLDLDMGVGRLTLKSRILGSSSLDYGIGDTRLILLGRTEEYRVEIDKGSGQARIEGRSVADDPVYGSGENRIHIEGGIGTMDVEFAS